MTDEASVGGQPLISKQGVDPLIVFNMKESAKIKRTTPGTTSQEEWNDAKKYLEFIRSKNEEWSITDDGQFL